MENSHPNTHTHIHTKNLMELKVHNYCRLHITMGPRSLVYHIDVTVNHNARRKWLKRLNIAWNYSFVVNLLVVNSLAHKTPNPYNQTSVLTRIISACVMNVLIQNPRVAGCALITFIRSFASTSSSPQHVFKRK